MGSLFQMYRESGLFEVMVSGQCLFQPLSLHYGERNAVCQRPALIHAAGEQRTTRVEQIMRCRYHRGLRVSAEHIEQLEKKGPIRSLGQPIADFHEHEVCSNRLSVAGPGQVHGLRMVLVGSPSSAT